MTIYANRGRSLEDFITYANKRYQAEGKAVVHKVPTPFIPIRDRKGRVVSCKVQEKSITDYLGRVGSRPIAAEAKHTKQKSIRFDAVQDHQAAFLDDFTAGGEGIGLVVISFNLDSFYAIPWAFWKEARDLWRTAPKTKKTVTFEETWTTPGKASVKEEELLPEWKVKVGGTIGLNWLDKYL